MRYGTSMSAKDARDAREVMPNDRKRPTRRASSEYRFQQLELGGVARYVFAHTLGSVPRRDVAARRDESGRGAGGHAPRLRRLEPGPGPLRPDDRLRGGGQVPMPG